MSGYAGGPRPPGARRPAPGTPAPARRASPSPARPQRPSGYEMTRRRRRTASFGLLSLATVAGLGWVVLGAGAKPVARTAAAVRLALPHLEAVLPAAAPGAGQLPAMPFPATGEGAVAVMGTGVVAESPRERAVPIASVTKMMTAYLVLKAHPLAGAEQGPSLTFTEKDHLAWMRYAGAGDSNVELVKGESLTERQLLEALLIPSADNVADILARWVGGTERAFVAEMNQTAALLGMDHTHYADASGLNPRSVSTAADQALLATVVMEDPVFRSIVSKPEVAFPVMGHVWNYNPAIGVDGIIGVKSGFTPQAEGCLVTAAWRSVGGRRVLVVSAVLGQVLGLGQAAAGDEALLGAATGKLRVLEPYGTSLEAARVAVPWLHASRAAALAAPLALVGFDGLRLDSALVGAPVTTGELRHGWPAGAVVGTLEVSSRFGKVAALPVTLVRAIPAPPPGSIVPRSRPTLPVGSAG